MYFSFITILDNLDIVSCSPPSALRGLGTCLRVLLCFSFSIFNFQFSIYTLRDIGVPFSTTLFSFITISDPAAAGDTNCAGCLGMAFLPKTPHPSSFGKTGIQILFPTFPSAWRPSQQNRFNHRGTETQRKHFSN